MPTGAAPRIGQFDWDTAADRWRWDAGMFAVHGYHDGAVRVTGDLVLQHKQPDSRARAEELMHLSTSTDQRFANYHGILDTRGCPRTVLVVGQSGIDTSGPGLPRRHARGFMVDVTDDQSRESNRAVEQVRTRAAPIQQSLGLLMGSLGLTEEQSFAFLTRISSHHNVKVRDLAPRFMGAAMATAAGTPRDLSELLVAEAKALALERIQQAHPAATSG